MQQTEPPGSLGPGAVRALKIVVVVMGLMIFLGLGLVAYRIVQLSREPGAQDVPAGETRRLAETGEIRLPAGASIKGIALSGHRLVVHFEAPTGSGIVIYDAASGRELSRVKLVPEAPSK